MASEEPDEDTRLDCFRIPLTTGQIVSLTICWPMSVRDFSCLIESLEQWRPALVRQPANKE